MCVLLLTAYQSVSQTSQDVHECSGALQLALLAIGEKQAGINRYKTG